MSIGSVSRDSMRSPCKSVGGRQRFASHGGHRGKAKAGSLTLLAAGSRRRLAYSPTCGRAPVALGSRRGTPANRYPGLLNALPQFQRYPPSPKRATRKTAPNQKEER